jgi:hypothetical protein
LPLRVERREAACDAVGLLLELVVGHDAVDVAVALGERASMSSATRSTSLVRETRGW